MDGAVGFGRVEVGLAGLEGEQLVASYGEGWDLAGEERLAQGRLVQAVGRADHHVR
ncbi:hypothetical protein [Actinoplanes sp. URMC 104]|uniref:hypothetical protein n=1 Tax=Actinoplanes sp. URMC 104 TaxID=3423409 RepID=UPI003F1B6295